MFIFCRPDSQLVDKIAKDISEKLKDKKAVSSYFTGPTQINPGTEQVNHHYTRFNYQIFRQHNFETWMVQEQSPLKIISIYTFNHVHFIESL